MGKKGDDLHEMANMSRSVAEFWVGVHDKHTVTPLCPPTTGTTTSLAIAKFWWISAINVEARTTSRVVTPKTLHLGVSHLKKKKSNNFEYLLGS